MIKICIIGSGIGAMSFSYGIAKYCRSPVELTVITGRRTGLESNMSNVHGHTGATNYLGEGGTTNIWGGLCKPYEELKRNTNPRFIDDAADLFGIQHAIDIWKDEPETNSLHVGYFAYATPMHDFFRSRLPYLNPNIKLKIVRGSDCTKITRKSKKYEIEYKSDNTRKTISGIDIVSLNAGTYHSPAILAKSDLDLNSKILSEDSPEDHYFQTLGHICTDKRVNFRSILPSNGVGKFGFIFNTEDKYQTIYLMPRLPYKVTQSRTGDRVMAISMLKRPLSYIRKNGLKGVFTLKSALNIGSLITSHLLGATQLDAISINTSKNEQRQSSSIEQLNDKMKTLYNIARWVQKQQKIECAPRSDDERPISAIHRTSNLVSAAQNIEIQQRRQDGRVSFYITDASTLQIRSSLNPSFTIATVAISRAEEMLNEWDAAI